MTGESRAHERRAIAARFPKGLPPVRLRDFKALTLDCHGTLIDWEAGVLRVLERWARRHGLQVSPDRLLEAFRDAEIGAAQALPSAVYPDILRIAHHGLSERFRIWPDPATARELAHSVADWPIFSDAHEALMRLARKHVLVAVTNVDRRSFRWSQASLRFTFDAVVTPEEAGAYKPDRRMFQYARELLSLMSITPAQTLHVTPSSSPELAPAQALGFATVAVNRPTARTTRGTTPPVDGRTPDLAVSSMAELAALLS